MEKHTCMKTAAEKGAVSTPGAVITFMLQCCQIVSVITVYTHVLQYLAAEADVVYTHVL